MGRVSKLEAEDADVWREQGRDRCVLWTPKARGTPTTAGVRRRARPRSLSAVCALAAMGWQVLACALHNALGAARLADVELCLARGGSLEWRDDSAAGLGMTPLQMVRGARTRSRWRGRTDVCASTLAAAAAT